MNTDTIKLYVEFNVDGYRDEYDKNSRYLKIQKINC